MSRSEEDLKAQYAEEYQFYYDKGNALYQLGKHEEAIASYRKATTLNPSCAWAYGNMAAVLMEVDRYNEALQAIDRALQIDPNDDDFRQNKADILKFLEKAASTDMGARDLTAELFAALSKFDARTAVALIEQGADVNAVDMQGNTPLHYFYQCPSIEGCKEVAQALVAHGAQVNALNRAGDTPLTKLQGITREEHKRELTTFLQGLGATLDPEAIEVKRERIAVKRDALAANVESISRQQGKEPSCPGASGGWKQPVLLVGLLAGMCLVLVLFRIVAGTETFGNTWGVLLALAIVDVVAGVYVFWLPTRPDPEEVQRVTAYIATIRTKGAREGWESFKSKLRFYLPPEWRRQKIGKEGWLIYPKGLGAPLVFSVWAFEGDPAFPDTKLETMVRNADDLGRRQGYRLIRNTVRECEVAGQKAIQYTLAARGKQRVLGYLWKYEGSDYQFLVEASSAEHLHIVRPAVAEFLQGMFMW